MWLAIRTQLSIFSLLFFLNDASAFKVLAIVSIPLKSHYMAFERLFHGLADRGHSVTVMNSFPRPNTPNLRYIDMKCPLRENFTSLQDYEHLSPSVMHLRNFQNHFTIGSEVVKNDCQVLLTNTIAKAHLDEGNKYDVIFVEQFVSDCTLAYAATHFNAPIIGITSHVMLPWTYEKLGIPFDVASNAHYFTTNWPNVSLLSKMESALMNLFTYIYGKPYMLYRRIYEAFEKYAPEMSLDLNRIARDRIKMMFAYQHYSITGARLLAPQLLEIAGIHITEPKEVPMDVEEFLSDAKHGAIYVSFGSNLKSSSMSPEKLQVFLAAFKTLPQKVLLKWELDETPVVNNNILWRKWFPQLDVLCHPKVLAFVSHGGMLSTSEAAHCGKPILAVPFFGDQYSNAAAVRAVGLGNTLNFVHITAETLANAIRELMSSEMQQSAQRVSRQWHDRPQSALDSAVFWTEYVARHGTGPPSLPAKDTSIFESLLLDIFGVAIVTLLIFIWFSYLVIRLLRRVLCMCLGRLLCRKKGKRE